jgi:hypothetical protein
MLKAQEIVRNYKITDSEMLQKDRVFLGLFTQDKQQFINLDADFSDPFAANWETAVNNADNAEKDLSVQDELTQLTDVVQQKMEAGRTHFQKMKYFIEKAFPDNRVVWNSFGYDDYDSARKSEIRFLPFLKNLHTQAVKNSAKLIAVNYKHDDIDKIQTIWQELLDADQEQETYKKDRLVITQERIQILNTAWEYVLKVNKASKNIYADNFAKLKQYLLPGEAAPEESEDNSSNTTNNSSNTTQ